VVVVFPLNEILCFWSFSFVVEDSFNFEFFGVFEFEFCAGVEWCVLGGWFKE
jgi:hypothetical protein